MYHFDLPQRVVAVVKQVARFPVVDAHDTQKQLSVQAQGQRAAGGTLGPDDDLDVLIDLVLQDLGLCELLVLVGSQPDAGELARLEQEVLGKKHGGGWAGLFEGDGGLWSCCLCRRVGSSGCGVRRRDARADSVSRAAKSSQWARTGVAMAVEVKKGQATMGGLGDAPWVGWMDGMGRAGLALAWAVAGLWLWLWLASPRLANHHHAPSIHPSPTRRASHCKGLPSRYPPLHSRCQNNNADERADQNPQQTRNRPNAQTGTHLTTQPPLAQIHW